MWRHLPQSHNGFLTQTIAEVLLRWIAAQIFEWKDREHDTRPFGFDLRPLDFGGIGCLALEAISLAQYGLDVLRIPRVVSQGITNLPDGGINAVIRVEVEILSPEALNNLLAADQSPFLPNQEDEQIHGDALHAHRFSGVSEFILACVQNERSELHSL